MSLTDYKAKYKDLKTKFQSTVDLAFRLGVEAGLQQSQLDQAAQQVQDANAMAQAAAGGQQPGQPGQPGEEAAPGEEAGAPEQPGQPVSQNPNGDELDQHISKLEGMLGKSEITSMELGDLKKTLSDIKSLQIQINLTKSMDAIKNTKMGKAPKAALNFTPRLQANLPEPAKKALSMQEKIVGDVFAKWAQEESKAASDISNILNVDGVVKKD